MKKIAIILSLFLSGCSIPLHITYEYNSDKLAKVLSSEPYWKGYNFSSDICTMWALELKGRDLNLLKQILRESTALREDIIIEWVERVKRRYDSIK